MAGLVKNLVAGIRVSASLVTRGTTLQVSKKVNLVPGNAGSKNFTTATNLLAAAVQKSAPNFKGTAVVDNQFKEIELKDYAGKYLVFFFYPLDFTFVCPTEIIAFSDRMKDFHAINTEVIGVSADSHFSHLHWIQQPRKEGGLGGIKYPLLSDFTKKISRDYGVLVEGPEIPLRALFIIDPEGIIRQMTINDLDVGRSVDEVLRLVKAFQFAKEHGAVCPANWSPENNPDTITPNPEDAKDYFNKANK